MQLYADQGDNTSDKWQLISQASDNDFLMKSNTTEVLRLTDGTGNLQILGGGTFGDDVTIQSPDTAGIVDSLTLINPRNSGSTGDGTQINFQNTGTVARSAFIKGISTGTYGQSNELAFGTSVGTDAPTESLRINSDKSLSFSKSAGATAVTASILHASNDFVYIRGGSAGLVIGDDATNSRIQIFNDAEIRHEIAGSEKMRLTSTGLGIGTDSPSS